SVEAEGTDVLAGAALDEAVRLAGLAHAAHGGRDRALGREPLEDLGRPVLRPVVDEDQLVAEPEDVADRPLDEAILVPEEPDADDLRHGASLDRHRIVTERR